MLAELEFMMNLKTLNMADKSISLVLCTVARTLVVIPRGYLPMSAINDIGYNHDINPTQESGRQSSSLQLHESSIPFLPTWPPFRSLSWVFRGIAPRDSPQNYRDEQKFYGQTKVLEKNKCSGLIVWAIFFSIHWRSRLPSENYRRYYGKEIQNP